MAERRRWGWLCLAPLLLAPRAAASYDPAQEASAYFHWLAASHGGQQPYMYDGKIQLYSRILFVNASRPQVIDFLDDNLENLSADPACVDCSLYAAAYASNEPDLQRRAAGLLRKFVYDGQATVRPANPDSLHTPAQRFMYVFRQLAQFLSQGYGRLPDDAPDVLGRLLAELRPDDSFFQDEFERVSTQALPNSLQRTLAESMLRALKGSSYPKWLERSHRDALDHSLERLRELVLERRPGDPPDPAWDTASQDVAVVAADRADPDAARFLGDALGSLPLDERGWQTFQPLYLAAYATGQPQLQARVLKLLRDRINGDDARFNAAASRWDMHAYFSDPQIRYSNVCEPGQCSTLEQDMIRRLGDASPASGPSGRAAFILEWIMRSAAQFAGLKDAAAGLIANLGVPYDLVAKPLEWYAVSRFDPGARPVAEQAIKELKSPDYLRQFTQSFGLGELTEALRRMSGIEEVRVQSPVDQSALTETFHRLGATFQDYPRLTSILTAYATRPETIAFLKDRMADLWNQAYGTFGLLVAGHSSGDPALARLAADLLRGAILNPPAAATPAGATPSDRLAYFFQQAVCYGWRLNDSDDIGSLAAKVADLFADLGLKYDLFRPLESRFSFHKYSPAFDADFSHLAWEKLLVKLKGERYVERLKRQSPSLDEEEAKGEHAGFLRELSGLQENLREGTLAPSWAAPAHEDPLVENLVSHAYDPEAEDAISRSLASATISPAYERYLVLLPAAYGSGNPRLKAQAMDLLKKRVLGRDADFNRTLGAGLATPARRFRFYLAELTGAADLAAPQRTAALFQSSVDLLAGLKLPYGLIQNELESLAVQKGDFPEKKAALELIKREKGAAYLSRVQARKRPPRTGYNVFVNGGFSPTANYKYADNALAGFYHDLFHSDAIVLSAAGADSPVAVLSDNGFVDSIKDENVKQTLSIDDPVAPATKANLEWTLGLLAKTSPDQLTVIYGGHGSPTDYAVWGDTLSWPNFNALYRKFPTQTFIKSVFLQCYGGGAITPPWRQVPTAVDSMPGFLEHYYPENRCSLSMSSGDELGQYFGPWSGYFQRHPGMTTDKLQSVLFADPVIYTSPRTTRDYFLMDLGSALCAEARSVSQARARYGDKPQRWPAEVRDGLGQAALVKQDFDKLPRVEKACAELQDSPVHDARQEYQRRSLYLDQALLLMAQWGGDVIRAEFPEFDPKKKPVGLSEADRLYAQYIADKKDDGFSPEELHAVMRMLATPHLYPVTIADTFSHSPKLVRLYNQKFKDFMALPGNQESYQQFLPSTYPKDDAKDIWISTMKDSVMRWVNQAASRRKPDERQYLPKQRAALEPLLQDLSSLAALRPLYESINACQAQPLDNDR